jgi:hypothetical protein
VDLGEDDAVFMTSDGHYRAISVPDDESIEKLQARATELQTEIKRHVRSLQGAGLGREGGGKEGECEAMERGRRGWNHANLSPTGVRDEMKRDNETGNRDRRGLGGWERGRKGGRTSLRERETIGWGEDILPAETLHDGEDKMMTALVPREKGGRWEARGAKGGGGGGGEGTLVVRGMVEEGVEEDTAETVRMIQKGAAGGNSHTRHVWMLLCECTRGPPRMLRMRCVVS